MRRPAHPKTGLLALALLIVAAGPAAAAGSLSSAKKESAKRGVPVLAEFFTDW